MSEEIIIIATVRISSGGLRIRHFGADDVLHIYPPEKNQYREVVWMPSSIHPICIQSTEKVKTEIRCACSTLLLLVTAAALRNVFDSLNTWISSLTQGMDIVHV